MIADIAAGVLLALVAARIVSVMLQWGWERLAYLYLRSPRRANRPMPTWFHIAWQTVMGTRLDARP